MCQARLRPPGLLSLSMPHHCREDHREDCRPPTLSRPCSMCPSHPCSPLMIMPRSLGIISYSIGRAVLTVQEAVGISPPAGTGVAGCTGAQLYGSHLVPGARAHFSHQSSDVP